MVAESIEQTEEVEKKVTLPYLTYTFGIGVASIALIIYWGITEFSFFISIAIGGLIQVLFRTTKKMWSNYLNPELLDSHKLRNPVVLGFIETLPSFKVFGFLYAVMVVVSAFWYAVGMFFNWLFS